MRVEYSAKVSHGAFAPHVDQSPKPALLTPDVPRPYAVPDGIAYAVGHLVAELRREPFDRIGAAGRDDHVAVVDGILARVGLADVDRSHRLRIPSLFGGVPVSIDSIISHFVRAYGGRIRFDVAHLPAEQRRWFEAHIEDTRRHRTPPASVQRKRLERLIEVRSVERWFKREHPKEKLFLLEGCETLVLLVDGLLAAAAKSQRENVFLAMSHRGRLAVLATVMKEPLESLAATMQDEGAPDDGQGDVVYHRGARRLLDVDGQRLDVCLCPNPSHLEAVDPVVLGSARAAADRGDATATIVIHGDAAFAGQGIVTETFNLSGLDAYGVGGSVHVVVDNQIGFTTLADQGRSTTNPTDVVRGFDVPVLHVDADDPNAVAEAAALAASYNRAFGKDVVVALVGVRKKGHIERDEPTLTQPMMYDALESKPDVVERYRASLGDIDIQPATKPVVASAQTHHRARFEPKVPPATDVGRLLGRLAALPTQFTAHGKVDALLGRRRQMATGARSVDWGSAELAAYLSIADGGVDVRLTGQDTERGAFAHRHAVLHDRVDGRRFGLLPEARNEASARIAVANSPLSEAAVLGFEYGYSVEALDALVVWEAQFGDFANGAQVVIDQFIASGDTKWGAQSRLTMLLPHGYEGGGPEHSSARLERWLTLCAEDNMRIVVPTNAAQLFHLLRDQAFSGTCPLVVLTPKNQLSHKSTQCPLAALQQGEFRTVIADDTVAPKDAARVLLCSGMIYHELAAHRAKHAEGDTAIVRIEQLYPWDAIAIANVLDAYRRDVPVAWVQEEPRNMGAASYVNERLAHRELSIVSRPAKASPAVGSMLRSRREAKAVIDDAFRVRA